LDKTFSELYASSLSIAQFLLSEIKEGERVVILLPQSLEYIEALFGCLYAGVVAVPLYPPYSKKHSPRVHAVINDCHAGTVLTTKKLKHYLESEMPHLRVMDIESCRRGSYLEKKSKGSKIALLQYTSGSTGRPKGVIVSH